MKREIDTKFFTFSQNNSGGYYVEDETAGIAQYVIIEAVDGKDACYRLQKAGSSVIGFDSFCGCCGQRWHDVYDDDADPVPSIFETPIGSYSNKWGTTTGFVHYFDGRIEKFVCPKG